MQAAQQRTEQAVGKAGLEQMALVGLPEQVVVAPRGRIDQARQHLVRLSAVAMAVREVLERHMR